MVRENKFGGRVDSRVFHLHSHWRLLQLAFSELQGFLKELVWRITNAPAKRALMAVISERCPLDSSCINYRRKAKPSSHCLVLGRREAESEDWESENPPIFTILLSLYPVSNSPAVAGISAWNMLCRWTTQALRIAHCKDVFSPRWSLRALGSSSSLFAASLSKQSALCSQVRRT